MNKKTSNPYLRDGVDVYLNTEHGDVTFVYLSTRKRLHLRCHPILVQTLALMTGKFSFEDIKSWIEDNNPQNLPNNAFEKFLDYLISKNIVVNKNYIEDINLPNEYKNFIVKQLNFLMDILDSVKDVEKVQQKIYNAKIAIFGIGAIGGWIGQQLAMMGFINFKLFDFDIVERTDKSRHCYYKHNEIGTEKTTVFADHLRSINPMINIESFNISLNIDTNLNDYLYDVDFIINAADEPYIGYTSLKLSRYCVSTLKPLFIAGGFDAHLASIGELIIPNVTPCSDCYANYFQKALENWKPIVHPVENRSIAFGGINSMSVFSASTSSLTILKYFINEENINEIGGRGEFLFPNYNLDTFEVYRNAECRVCKNKTAP